MAAAQQSKNQHLMFRLDFVLRGHGAYTEPMPLAALIELVERTQQTLGAPLLRHLEYHAGRSKD